MRRSIRSECAILSVVFALPAALACLFPYGALNFRASASDGRADAQVAFVTLTPEAERAAVRAARLSSHSSEGDVRTLVADLLADELPQEQSAAVLTLGERSRLPAPTRMEAPVSPFLPSRRAAPPVRIKKEDGDVVTPPFSKEELLKMN